MSLRAQIELMTVPQEFTRLCNAVLIAEHGDDFLPIDDDRADRGNDGYLKSEQRMFAGHCFKRVQNQAIDKLIRSKMIGDLGKAIALKRADVWPIDTWTFLSNYAISEQIAAEVVEMGRGAEIDVSWKGPDYFAAALTRHTESAAEFRASKLTSSRSSLHGSSRVSRASRARTPTRRTFVLPGHPRSRKRCFVSYLRHGSICCSLACSNKGVPRSRPSGGTKNSGSQAA
jgi:hypothetical protein